MNKEILEVQFEFSGNKGQIFYLKGKWLKIIIPKINTASWTFFFVWELNKKNKRNEHFWQLKAKYLLQIANINSCSVLLKYLS